MRRSLTLAIVLALGAPAAHAQEGDGESDDVLFGRRVQQLLRAHQADVFACVSAEHHAPSGELLVRLVVDEQGHAARADVLKTNLPAQGKSLSDCLLPRIRNWDLSPLGATAGDQVVFPLAFHPDPTAPDAPVRGVELHRTLGTGPRESEPHLVVRRFELRGGQTMLLPGASAALFVIEGALRLVAAPGVDDVLLGTHDVAYFAGPAAGSGRSEAEGTTRLLEIAVAPSPSPSAGASKIIRAATAPRTPLPGGESVRLLDEGVPFSLALLQAAAGSVPRARHAASDEYLYVLAGRIDVTTGGRPSPLAPGELARLSRNQSHTLSLDHALYVELHTPPLAPTDRHTLKKAQP